MRIVGVKDETPTVRTLEFEDRIMSEALPGQFAMVWVPGVGELPMSVMTSDGSCMAAFTVRRHGPSSTGLYNAGSGDQIGVRGPFGNHFDVRGDRIALVGGGTGLVPLMRMLETCPGADYTVLMGARTAKEVLFEERAGRAARVMVSTEDGTRGERGLVTECLERLLGRERFDAVYTCGPELMMRAVVNLASRHRTFVQASVERVMKCGIGICGSCCMDDRLVCRDGTIFDGSGLVDSSEFGLTCRTKSGTPRALQEGLK